MRNLNFRDFILLGAVVFVSIAFINEKLKVRELEKASTKPLTEITTPNDSLKTWRDTSGAAHTVFVDRIITGRDLTAPANKTYIDSLAAALNIKASEVTESARINIRLAGTIKALEAKIDSLGRKTWPLNGKYLKGTFSEVDSSLTYTYDGELSYNKYDKKNARGKIIAKVIDIHSPDTNFIVSGLRQFSIEDPVKPVKTWGIGIQGGRYYIPELGRSYWGVGAGITKTLIRF